MHRFRFALACAAAYLTTTLAFAAPASNTAASDRARGRRDGRAARRLPLPAGDPRRAGCAHPGLSEMGARGARADRPGDAGGRLDRHGRREDAVLAARSLDMFLVRVEVPAGAAAVEVAFDYLSPNTGFGAGYGTTPNATPHLLIADWHDLVVYPLGPSLGGRPGPRHPAPARGLATRLLAGGRRAERGDRHLRPDHPLHAARRAAPRGRLFRTIEIGPAERISLAADRRSALTVPEARIAAYRQLPGEAQALFGGKHYRGYHWLVALSEPLEHNGLEHHESSDNRGVLGMFTDENHSVRNATLLAHEYVHSWNGKYRRPAGLAVRDSQQPLQTELLWVYEGLTRYLGDLVLSSRTGIWTPEQSHEFIAYIAANQDHNRPGRSWRPLADTAVAVQSLGGLPSGWTAYRRTLDYYDESMLIWLEADTILREKSGGKKSLDDFCRAFFGGDQPPAVVPYTADDLYAALGRVAPYDWRGFFAARIEAVSPRAPLGGIEAAGWKLVYNDTPNTYQSARSKGQKVADASLSLGLWIKGEDGAINDIVVGAPAWEAGLGPGMKITAINGRKWSTDVFAEELAAKPDMEITAEQGEELRTFRIVKHGGPRSPHLVRDETKPDRLKEILAPRTRTQRNPHQLFVQPIQHLDPARMRPGALRQRFLDGLAQGELRPAAEIGEGHRHGRLARPLRVHPDVRRPDQVAALVRDGHGVDDPLRCDDLAIDAFAPAVVTLGNLDAGVKGTAGAEVDGAKEIVQPCGANQRFRCSGSVHAAKTRSRGASNTRVMRTSCMVVLTVMSLTFLEPAARADNRPIDRSPAPRISGSATATRRPLSSAPPRECSAPRARPSSGRSGRPPRGPAGAS